LQTCEAIQIFLLLTSVVPFNNFGQRSFYALTQPAPKIFFALELSKIMTPLKAAYQFAHTLTLRSSISLL